MESRRGSRACRADKNTVLEAPWFSMPSPITVVLADDSALMRREIKNILSSDRELRVIGCARHGQDAVEMVKQLQPDVVTMDINMPVMDGITALQIIMMESPRPVVMLSSLTQAGAMTTFECLELGAVDYIPKPSGTISTDIATQSAEIIAKVKQAARARPGRRLRTRAAAAPVALKRSRLPVGGGAAGRVVAIGVSTGGPKTLLEVVPRLPADLDAAVVIVQHMPEAFTGPFAQRIDASSALRVKEAEAGDVLMPGCGYLARGGKHMTFSKPSAARGAMVRMVSQPSDLPHIPAVDVMMSSAVAAFGEHVIGVLLTGMGDDGADAMVEIRRAGGRTIAEHESTCVVYGMPCQAVARGGAEFVLPCYEIADKIVELLAGCRV